MFFITSNSAAVGSDQTNHVLESVEKRWESERYPKVNLS